MAKNLKKKDWLTFNEVVIRDYKNFRWLVLMMAFLGGPVLMFIAWPLPEDSYFNVLLFGCYLITYLIELIALYLLFLNGWFLWFSIFVFSTLTGLAISFAVGLFRFANVSLSQAMLVAASWLFLSPFMYWWGSRMYVSKGELKEAIFRAKRINLEAGTYAPYCTPHDLYQTKWNKFLISSYGLVLTLALVIAGSVSHFVSSRSMDPDHYLAVFAAYFVVLLMIASLSGWFQEFRFIRHWEKETGRKMYISYVVDWKRYKEQEKQKKQQRQAQKRD